MYTQVKEQRRSGVMPSAVVRQCVMFADNRLSSIAQKNLCLGIEKQTIQRAPTRTENQKDTFKYDVTYTGRQKDFIGGGDPTGVGVGNVQSYSATAYITRPKNEADINKNVNINAATHEYHRGHMLSQALGGSGDKNNIFWQDGGQNTAGPWFTFERQIEKARRFSDLGMVYRVILNGPGLAYYF